MLLPALVALLLPAAWRCCCLLPGAAAACCLALLLTARCCLSPQYSVNRVDVVTRGAITGLPVYRVIWDGYESTPEYDYWVARPALLAKWLSREELDDMASSARRQRTPVPGM